MHINPPHILKIFVCKCIYAGKQENLLKYLKYYAFCNKKLSATYSLYNHSLYCFHKSPLPTISTLSSFGSIIILNINAPHKHKANIGEQIIRLASSSVLVPPAIDGTITNNGTIINANRYTLMIWIFENRPCFNFSALSKSDIAKITKTMRNLKKRCSK